MVSAISAKIKMISNNGMISMKYIKKYVPRNGQNFIEIWYFVTKIVLTHCEKKNVIVIEKDF